MQDPVEPATLAGAMDELARRGFTEQFTLVNERLRGVGSRHTFTADRAHTP
jgi:hypothetical protein